MNNYPMAGLVPMPLNSVKVDSKAPFADYPDMLQVKHLVEITLSRRQYAARCTADIFRAFA